VSGAVGLPDHRGRLVYVIGASGVGKDTLIGYARRRLAGQDVCFAHRYITREPATGDENFIALTPREFDQRRRRGLFAMHWAAHGCAYGVGIEIREWRRRGLVVVVNGSRGYFERSLRDEPAIVPVLITAPACVLAARLAQRGREDSTGIEARLRRSDPPRIAHRDLVLIENAAAIATSGERLVATINAARDWRG
jgi:ribose 1,5-bisphosphokinase